MLQPLHLKYDTLLTQILLLQKIVKVAYNIATVTSQEVWYLVEPNLTVRKNRNGCNRYILSMLLRKILLLVKIVTVTTNYVTVSQIAYAN